MQDESGRPLSGVGWLSRIDIKRKLIGINDFQFILTDSSKFLTEDSRPATANLFHPETLVRFEANGKGEILSLWQYIDTENEYSLKNPPERTNGKSDNLSTGKNVNKEKLVKEKGVWKN